MQAKGRSLARWARNAMSDKHDQHPHPAANGPADPSAEGSGHSVDNPGPIPIPPSFPHSSADGDELLLGAHQPQSAGSVADSEPFDPLNSATEQADRRDGTAAQATPAEQVRQRRVWLPLTLFIVTCLSTFWVGVNHWLPIPADGGVRQALLAHWGEGLTYMGCVLAILLAHEMGHFLMTLRYRIPASFPYFIPFPISPIGTMGAVIGMDGLKADRKELFDIGLAGPLAGLVIAIPMLWIGIARLDFNQVEYGPFAMDLPLMARMMLHYIQPAGYTTESVVWFSNLNPFFMAGWVGLLITGLNMLPVSQLDGGHVVYTLFGRKAHWIARTFIVSAILMVAISGRWTWIPMILLVLFIGPDHPPTRDDHVALGRVRTVLGFAAMLIPVFCFPVRLMIIPS